MVEKMIKRIKKYFGLRKRIDIEILETLCSICLYLEIDGHFGHNRYARYMGSHFKQLKQISEEIRGGK